MTKRDVTIWFCKAIALAGLVSGLFSALSLVGFFFGVGGGFSLFTAVPTLLLYIFVWFSASAIGTVIAAEGEYGEPMASTRELSSILLRCGGFLLCLQGVLAVTNALLTLASYMYWNVGGMVTNWSAIPRYFPVLLPMAVVGLIQFLLGFILAFGPRLRSVLRI
ncbi:hypothetical protein EON80_17095 [bacterium]|nr:MAG: hypothetical protein EON80_17095 [bacterium]